LRYLILGGILVIHVLFNHEHLMSKIEKNIQGFKPGKVCQILGVTKQTFRYWRENLYPENDKKEFNLDDIFMYQFIKSFIQVRRLMVKELLDVEWQCILDELSRMDKQEKQSSIAVFDTIEKKFYIKKSFSDFDPSEEKYVFLSLGNIMKRFNASIYNFVDDGSNVISFEKQLIAGSL